MLGGAVFKLLRWLQNILPMPVMIYQSIIDIESKGKNEQSTFQLLATTVMDRVLIYDIDNLVSCNEMNAFLRVA